MTEERSGQVARLLLKKLAESGLAVLASSYLAQITNLTTGEIEEFLAQEGIEERLPAET